MPVSVMPEVDAADITLEIGLDHIGHDDDAELGNERVAALELVAHFSAGRGEGESESDRSWTPSCRADSAAEPAPGISAREFSTLVLHSGSGYVTDVECIGMYNIGEVAADRVM